MQSDIFLRKISILKHILMKEIYSLVVDEEYFLEPISIRRDRQTEASFNGKDVHYKLMHLSAHEFHSSYSERMTIIIITSWRVAWAEGRGPSWWCCWELIRAFGCSEEQQEDNIKQINKRINQIPLYQRKSHGWNFKSSNAFDDLIKIRFIFSTQL